MPNQMDYDEAVKRWAASKVYNCDWTLIDDVKFGYHKEGFDEGTCEFTVPDIRIYYKGNDERGYWESDESLGNAFNPRPSFGDMIREISEIAIAGSSELSFNVEHSLTLREEAEQARKERDSMRGELQKVIHIARDAYRRMGESFERLGEGVE